MRKRDAVCGLLAVLAVVIYMLACGSRPAWSPDSKRVVFSFYNPETKVSGLALYDLQSRETKAICQRQGDAQFQPVWLGQQEQVLALATRGEDLLDILQIDLDQAQAKVLNSISVNTAQAALAIPPILVDQRYLFFSAPSDVEEQSSMQLHRFDIESGGLLALEGGLEHYLFQVSTKFFYLAADKDEIEVGKLDPKKLEFKRLFSLSKDGEYGEIRPTLAGKRNASEIVLITRRQAEVSGQEAPDDTLMALIFSLRGKLRTEIRLPGDPETSHVLHVVYGPKGKSLWLPVVDEVESRQAEESKDYKISLLEVDIKDGRAEVIVEATVEQDQVFGMQPSISPNGKWLAANVLVSKDNPESVLYLVDLTDPERNVTEVRPPREEPAEETPITEQAGNE